MLGILVPQGDAFGLQIFIFISSKFLTCSPLGISPKIYKIITLKFTSKFIQIQFYYIQFHH